MKFKEFLLEGIYFDRKLTADEVVQIINEVFTPKESADKILKEININRYNSKCDGSSIAQYGSVTVKGVMSEEYKNSHKKIEIPENYERCTVRVAGDETDSDEDEKKAKVFSVDSDGDINEHYESNCQNSEGVMQRGCSYYDSDSGERKIWWIDNPQMPEGWFKGFKFYIKFNYNNSYITWTPKEMEGTEVQMDLTWHEDED